MASRPIVMRKGHRDYIELPNKRKAVVRVWDHHTASWRLTPLGRQWARQQQSEFVVSIPIIMVIHRKDGSEQEFKGYLPASNVRMYDDLQEALAMGAGLERRRAIAEIKREFKNRLRIKVQGQRRGYCAPS